MKILVLNAGSSSQKSCLYALDSLPSHPPEPIWKADIDWYAKPDSGLLTVKARGVKQSIPVSASDRILGIECMLKSLVEGETRVLESLAEISIVGHRVVHGGIEYSTAIGIAPEVKETIKALIPLAPNHNPAHIEGIEAIERILGDVPQIAVFDTAFHRSIPPASSLYPIPYEWAEQGIRRYGFHGTSHQYCSRQAADILDRPIESLKTIVAHLGNGASLSAVRGGVCIDTTMGFTPLEGLMMGTRSGSIDPAILIYLQQEWAFTPEKLNTLLNKESGLKGVSGISADMRTVILAMQEGDERSKLAFDMYIHRLKSCLGSMLASLEGLDALVFTAGVGENSAIVRERACQGWDFLGLQLDKEKNESHPVDTDISTAESKVRILVIHTEEDWAIARECWQYAKFSGSL
ncbi:acetate kinase [Pannus brasiliensis CCIBt3594]|uniref:Acetate kinase n=1 Tax=Pannus brasiliensis CCIBt3594 TaxID=1427578 RepID=A0AAW9QTW6_9CHRO